MSAATPSQSPALNAVSYRTRRFSRPSSAEIVSAAASAVASSSAAGSVSQAAVQATSAKARAGTRLRTSLSIMVLLRVGVEREPGDCPTTARSLSTGAVPGGALPEVDLDRLALGLVVG